MKTQVEMTLIDFLTSKDNLPFAVEILWLGDDIRKSIVARFWRELHCRLESSPDRPSTRSSMQLSFYPDDRMTDPLTTGAGLWYYDAILENEDQYLSYFIEMDYGKSYFWLEVGIAWNEELPSKSSKLHRLKPVVELREILEEMEFKEGMSAMGWGLPLKFDSVDDFLVAFARDSEGILREMTERFWLLVKDTLSQVEAANEAIVGHKLT